MLQVIRAIAWGLVAVGASTTNDDAILVPAIMVFLGLVLLKISEVLDGEVNGNEKENTERTRS